MKKIRCEFFALPSEALLWAQDWAREHGFVVALSSTPQSGEWTLLTSPEELLTLESVELLGFLAQPKVKRDLRDTLFINIGKLRDNSLRPSFLGGETDDEALLKRWREVVSSLKAKTKTGLWLVEPGSSLQARSKTTRYSEEAGRRGREGLVLRALAGWNVYQVDEPPLRKI